MHRRLWHKKRKVIPHEKICWSTVADPEPLMQGVLHRWIYKRFFFHFILFKKANVYCKWSIRNPVAWLGLRIENTNTTLCHILKVLAVDKIFVKKFSLLWLWKLLKRNDRQYSVNLDQDRWLAEFMGLQAMGLIVSEKIFKKIPFEVNRS